MVLAGPEYAIVFAMTVKPTSDDGWTVLVGAALLVVLTAVFLAQVRPSGPEVQSAVAD